MRSSFVISIFALLDHTVDLSHSAEYEKNIGFLNGTGRGSRARGEAFRDALIREMRTGTIGLGVIAMESGKPVIQSASKEWEHEGRYYYWDRQQRRHNEEILCYMLIEDLVKLSQKPINSAGSDEASDNSNQTTSPEDPYVLLQKLQYRDGSRPSQITWACSEKEEETCCGIECCTSADLPGGSLGAAILGVVVIVVLTCCCCIGCYACREWQTASQARRDRELMGGPIQYARPPPSTNAVQFRRPPYPSTPGIGPTAPNQVQPWQPPRPPPNLAGANYPRQQYPKPKPTEEPHSPPENGEKGAEKKDSPPADEKPGKQSPPEKGDGKPEKGDVKPEKGDEKPEKGDEKPDKDDEKENAE